MKLGLIREYQRVESGKRPRPDRWHATEQDAIHCGYGAKIWFRDYDGERYTDAHIYAVWNGIAFLRLPADSYPPEIAERM